MTSPSIMEAAVPLPPALLARFPHADERLHVASLGAFPTPVEPLDDPAVSARSLERAPKRMRNWLARAATEFGLSWD